MPLLQGSAAARAKLITAYRVPSIYAKRQDSFANGLVLIGGAGALKSNGTAGEAKKPGEGTAAGGLSGIDKARKSADEALKNADEALKNIDKARQRLDGAKGGEGKAGGEKAKPAEGEKAAPAEGEKAKPAEGEKAAPAEGEKAAPAEGEKAAPAEGEKATPAEGEKAAPAEGENAKPAEGEKAVPAKEEKAPAEGTKAEDLTAVKEGEQFKGNQGITVDRNGITKNLGGSAGITKGSDGSTSVGGAAGINILSTGDNTAAEEEVEQFEEDE